MELFKQLRVIHNKVLDTYMHKLLTTSDSDEWLSFALLVLYKTNAPMTFFFQTKNINKFRGVSSIHFKHI
jgi:hypothetical protein